MEKYKILLVEADPQIVADISHVLIDENFQLDIEMAGLSAVEKLSQFSHNLLIIDYNLPDMTASQVMMILNRRFIKIPFIVMVKNSTEEIAIEMMRLGAKDYFAITKGFQYLLISSIKKNVEQIKLEEQLKKSKRSLYENEIRYQAIVENSSVGVLFFDSQNIIMSANQKTASLFGYLRNELYGMSIQQLIVVDPQKLEMELDYPLDTQVGSSERLGIKKQGGIFPVDVNYSGYLQGEQTVFIAFIRDITDRKLSEAKTLSYQNNLEKMIELRTLNLREEIEMRKKTELELKKANILAQRASVAKSEFISNMSHELRTPLNSIIGFAKILKRGYNEAGYDQAVNTILFSSTHLLNMINDILDLTKLDAGKVELHKSKVLLQSLLEESLNLIKVQTDDKNISLILENNCKKDFVIFVDKKRIYQVMINLLSNACKFTPEGGKILIKASLKKEQLEIEVADNGIGIDAKHHEYIFNKFSQVNTSIRRGKEGTGLGLSICKKILTSHGGNISLISSLGNGSRFIFWLPLTNESIIESTKKTMSFSQKNLILIVDDDFEIIRLLKSYLDMYEISNVTTSTGLDAIEECKKNNFDLIIMDIMLPGINGDIAMRKIKNINSQIPVIALTGKVNKKSEKDFLDMGFDDFVSKPIDFAIIDQILLKYLS